MAGERAGHVHADGHQDSPHPMIGGHGGGAVRRSPGGARRSWVSAIASTRRRIPAPPISRQMSEELARASGDDTYYGCPADERTVFAERASTPTWISSPPPSTTTLDPHRPVHSRVLGAAGWRAGRPTSWSSMRQQAHPAGQRIHRRARAQLDTLTSVRAANRQARAAADSRPGVPRGPAPAARPSRRASRAGEPSHEAGRHPAEPSRPSRPAGRASRGAEPAPRQAAGTAPAPARIDVRAARAQAPRSQLPYLFVLASRSAGWLGCGKAASSGQGRYVGFGGRDVHRRASPGRCCRKRGLACSFRRRLVDVVSLAALGIGCWSLACAADARRDRGFRPRRSVSGRMAPEGAG
jgi:hypothetical protein